MIIRVKDLKPKDIAALIKEGWLTQEETQDPNNIIAQFNL